MAVYAIHRYPRDLELRDGTRVCLRPMAAGDADALLAFFHRIPEQDRFFLKDDVTSPLVIQAWATHLDYDRALPLLAWQGDRIVADGVLIRHRGGARRDTAEIRIVVDPEVQNCGLGVAMISELLDIASDAELGVAVFELVKEAQGRAIEAVQSLGAIESGTVSGLVKDSHGRPHDLVFMTLPLGRWWKWSRY